MAQSHDKMLHRLQKESFGYFAREYNPSNGLVRDKTEGLSPSSIAVTGFSLAAYIVAVERGFISRSEALRRTLTAVRFFAGSSHEAEADATGHRGFYYHFLDMEKGRRAWACELSTMDTGFLILGMLVAAEYFSGDNARERELRERVDELYYRVEWDWACNRAHTLSHGYSPEKGFLKYRWRGYNEIATISLGPWFGSAFFIRRELPRMDAKLSMEMRLWLRISLCRAAVHSPVHARLDRFSRTAGRLHEGEVHRLF